MNLTRHRSESFEWADVCTFCSSRIVPPSDGHPLHPDAWTMHLCGAMPIPWSALVVAGMVPENVRWLVAGHPFE